MTTEVANPQDVIERRKSAAVNLLRWMDDEIIRAPEEHVRALGDNIAVAVCRTALERSAKSGNKVTASVLCSIDGQRLNSFHMAAMQDPSHSDGRKSASEHTVKAAKFLTLEHKLIDDDLVQYTVAADATRMGPQSRMDRTSSARYLIEVISEMSHG